jgi:tetratricopeptide (TPR) repeat protein
VVVLKRLLLPLLLIACPPLLAQDAPRQSARAQKQEDLDMADKVRKLMENRRATNDRLLEGLKALQDYNLRYRTDKDREYLMYAQGMLEVRTDQQKKAIATFRRFERTWPDSTYMTDINYELGMYALGENDHKEIEVRFRACLESDLPVETKLNLQGLLVWSLVEQGRSAEAAPFVESLFPIGRSKPDERGLMAIMQVQCEIKDLEGAKKTRAMYMGAYKDGPMIPRLNTMWGMLAVELGKIDTESVGILWEIIKAPSDPKAADEARIILATLLADGKMPENSNPDGETVDSLISKLGTEGTSGDAKQRAVLLRTRLAFGRKEWDRVLALTAAFEKVYPSSTHLAAAHSFRDKTNEILENDRVSKLRESVKSKGAIEAMPLLTAENIRKLTPEMRSGLVSAYVAKGLPEAASMIIKASPDQEKAALRQTLTDYTPEPLPPPKVLASVKGDLMGHKGELGQVQTLLEARKWNDASSKIEKLAPGPDRVKAVMALLLRPMTPSEAQLRRKEAEGWLAKLQEGRQDIEPLVILIADLHMQAGGAKDALAVYPEKALPENQGWVSLMRATAYARLGQKDEARRVLGENATVPEFRQHRRALANQLGRGEVRASSEPATAKAGGEAATAKASGGTATTAAVAAGGG